MKISCGRNSYNSVCFRLKQPYFYHHDKKGSHEREDVVNVVHSIFAERKVCVVAGASSLSSLLTPASLTLRVDTLPKPTNDQHIKYRTGENHLCRLI